MFAEVRDGDEVCRGARGRLAGVCSNPNYLLICQLLKTLT
jgi:hypothetical protein